MDAKLKRANSMAVLCYDSSQYYDTLDKIFKWGAVILVFTAAALQGYNAAFFPQQLISVSGSIIGFIAGLLKVVHNQSTWEQNAITFRSISNEWRDLGDDIKDNSIELDEAAKTFDELRKDTPNIPSNVYNKFVKKYNIDPIKESLGESLT